MSDHAASSLSAIIDGVKDGSYVLIPDVAIFDEHDEYAKGKLVRRFDKARLQAIADRCNRREVETGDLAPIGPGHTIPGPHVPETSQPPIWGFAHGYRVDRFGSLGKSVVRTDFYARAEHAEKIKREFPRRSIELYPKDNLIDWIAVLRRSPQRDLGLLAYSKTAYADGQKRWCPWAVAPERIYADQGRKHASAAVLTPDGKLRYAMEADTVAEPNINVADPSNPPDVQVPADNGQMSPENMALADSMLRYFCSKIMGMAPPALPAPVPAVPVALDKPGGDPPADDDDKLRMQKGSEATRYARLEQQLNEMKAREADANQRYQKAECERIVTQLESEGYELDRAEEVNELLAMAPDKRPGYVARISKRYQRSPIGGGFIRTEEATPNDAYGAGGREKHEKAMRYMRENPGVQYQDALAKAA